jgi:hypothetical protein
MEDFHVHFVDDESFRKSNPHRALSVIPSDPDFLLRIA